MRIVSAADIDAVMKPAALADSLAQAFAGDVVAPQRVHLDIERGDHHATLLLMPAWTKPAQAAAFMATKIVSVFPKNGERGLPSVYGTVLLSDGETGRPLAVMDGTCLTVWRTAAASALAARHLARPDASRMVMVGAGALAPFLIRAHMAERPLRDVALWNHRPERARAVARDLSAQGLPVRAVETLEAEIRQADIVSCATLSREPLVHGTWLAPGVHIDCVGAFRPDMRETDDEAVRRASLFCDTPGALVEGGDLAAPIASGVIRAQDVQADLSALVRGLHPGRRSESEITLFKSAGAALEDLAAAVHVWQRLPAPGQ